MPRPFSEKQKKKLRREKKQPIRQHAAKRIAREEGALMQVCFDVDGKVECMIYGDIPIPVILIIKL